MEKARMLKKLIEEKGSIKAFADKISIPYTTLYSILERGVGKASVDNVIKICKGLEITVEELEKMTNDTNGNLVDEKSVQYITISAPLEGEPLSEKELEDINDYISFLLFKRKK